MDRNRYSPILALAFTGLAISASPLRADSPPNLKTDINWVDSGGEYEAGKKLFDANFGGVGDIELAFNHARREEEKQLQLEAGLLGSLDLPDQAIWSSMTDDAKALYLINAERTARHGMLPNVIGLPLAGIESHIDAISHDYGDRLHDNDLTGHNHDGPPTYRIERAPVIGSLHLNAITYPNDASQTDPTQEAPSSWITTHTDGLPHQFGDEFNGQGSCHEFLTRSENLAYYSSTAPIPLPLERSIYSFLYDDAGSHWGHREAVLLQDNGLSYSDRPAGETGYRNNQGSDQNEGFMGVYVRSSNIYDNPLNTYQPFQQYGDFSYGTVVVMNFFDPVADGTTGCSYTVTTSSESLPGKSGTPLLIASDDTVTTTIGTPVTIDLLTNDAGTDQSTTVTVIIEPAHGSASLTANRQLDYQPVAGFTGTDQITYQLTDSKGRKSSAIVGITVTAGTDTADTSKSSTTPVTPGSPATQSSGESTASGGGALGWLGYTLLVALGGLRQRRQKSHF